MKDAEQVRIGNTQRLYHRAKQRVEALYPDDATSRDFCLADWPEGDEHWEWLINAPEAEIRSWVDAGRE